MRRLAAIAVLAAMLLMPSAAAASPPDAREAKAESLVTEGRARFAEGSFGQRRVAIRLLEEAAQLDPRRTTTLEALGRAYLDAGFNHRARVAFEKAARLDPRNPEAWFGLAQLYKRNWLRSLADEDFTRAATNAEAALRLDRGHCGAAVMLAVLRVERGAFGEARAIVSAALAAGCRAPQLQLASAYLTYRSGDAARAESLLTAVRARLAPEVAARFDDVVPMLGAEDGEAVEALPHGERVAYSQRFWGSSDPDPTTELNEAVVEYHARVAHALLVFSDTWNMRWDMRAALYVRFGAPGRVTFLPVGLNDSYRLIKGDAQWTDPNTGETHELVPHMDMPMNVQVWEYPQLGMTVRIEDTVLSQSYEMPRTDSVLVEARVDTTVAEQNGLVPAGAGRAVFSPLLPGVRRLAVAGRVSRFTGVSGPHLLVQFEVPGAPADTLAAKCVILDSTGRRVAESFARPDPSRCDPATQRTMDFTFDVPAGRYRLAFAVSDANGGRGVARAALEIPATEGGLSMSDVVPVCGPYDASAGQGPVRLAANVGSRFDGASRLNAYFEVYGLATDANGSSSFDLAYEVHRLREEPARWYQKLRRDRPHPLVAVRTEDSGFGGLRRQFVQVPLEALPKGEYRLEIHLHDRLRGGTVTRTLEFVR